MKEQPEWIIFRGLDGLSSMELLLVRDAAQRFRRPIISESNYDYREYEYRGRREHGFMVYEEIYNP